MKTTVLRPRTPQETDSAVLQAARALTDGELVGFATETVYGVGAIASNACAMDRLRELKKRPDKPFSVHVGKSDDVSLYVKDISTQARRLINKAWPGPVTLVLEVGSRLADGRFGPEIYDRLCRDGKIGLRCPDHPAAQKMLSAVAGPVVAPSANFIGRPSPRTADEVLKDLDGLIDLLIDTGPTRYGCDSTIVKVGSSGYQVLREGVLDSGAIDRLMRLTLLFVCTGNTCRSPLAMGLTRMKLARRAGVTVEALAEQGYEVISAGLFAVDGIPASTEAVEVAALGGADISAHRSRKLTAELINQADMVFCMTRMHVDEVNRLAPRTAAKVVRLDDGRDIIDPVGSGCEAYREVSDQIEQALQKRIDEIMD